MDGTAMIKEAPFLGSGGGEMLMEDEFMVVPSVVEDSFPTTQLDEFLLEANFAGLTGTILSPPSVDHVHSSYCTSEQDVGRQPVSQVQADVQGFLFDQPKPDQYQETFTQQHQFFNLESDFSTNVFGAGQYFDDTFDFDGGQEQSQPSQEEAIVFDPVWPESDGPDVGAGVVTQAQLSVLDDPESTWLAENADLNFIEQMTTENDQHCQLLDELLRDDRMFQDTDPMSVDDDDEATPSDETEVSTASEILSDIYRQAQELDFASMSVMPAVPSASARPSRPQSLKSSSPMFHLADHDFGSARRGRPPGSTKKRGVLKRDLKSKKQHQNREAALRYRLKKKAEKVEMESELEQLEKRNLFLKTEVHTLTAELKYMKELFLEFRKVRGV